MTKKISFFTTLSVLFSLISLAKKANKGIKQSATLVEQLNQSENEDDFIKNHQLFKDFSENYFDLSIKQIMVIEGKVKNYDCSSNEPLKKILTELSGFKNNADLIKKTSNIQYEYVILFGRGQFNEAFDLLNNFIKDEKIIENYEVNNNEIYKVLSREILDGFNNTAAMLKINDFKNYEKNYADIEFFSKWFSNNDDLNKKASSKSSLALRAFVNNDVDLARHYLKEMFTAKLSEEKLKSKEKLTESKQKEIINKLLLKESGEGELRFFFQKLPVDFLTLVKEVGNNFKTENNHQNKVSF